MIFGDLFRIELSGGGLANAFDNVTGFNDGFRVDVVDDDGFSGGGAPAALPPPTPLLPLLVVVIVVVGFALFAVEAICQFMCVSVLVLV